MYGDCDRDSGCGCGCVLYCCSKRLALGRGIVRIWKGVEVLFGGVEGWGHEAG